MREYLKTAPQFDKAFNNLEFKFDQNSALVFDQLTVDKLYEYWLMAGAKNALFTPQLNGLESWTQNEFRFNATWDKTIKDFHGLKMEWINRRYTLTMYDSGKKNGLQITVEQMKDNSYSILVKLFRQDELMVEQRSRFNTQFQSFKTFPVKYAFNGNPSVDILPPVESWFKQNFARL